MTVVSYQRECLLGEVVNGEIVLNDLGKVVDDAWRWLENQYPYVELGTWIVMPNHFHGILIIHEMVVVGAVRDPPLRCL